jgi:hypothetical protein
LIHDNLGLVAKLCLQAVDEEGYENVQSPHGWERRSTRPGQDPLVPPSDVPALAQEEAERQLSAVVNQTLDEMPAIQLMCELYRKLLREDDEDAALQLYRIAHRPLWAGDVSFVVAWRSLNSSASSFGDIDSSRGRIGGEKRVDGEAGAVNFKCFWFDLEVLLRAQEVHI